MAFKFFLVDLEAELAVLADIVESDDDIAVTAVIFYVKKTASISETVIGGAGGT